MDRGDCVELIIDGLAFDVKCEVSRAAEVSASELSGLLMDRSWFNDVLGTYMTYEIQFTYPLYSRDKYAALYEKLTEPVDAHSFVLPYNAQSITLTARVETISDDLLELDNGKKYWRSCRFSIIANHPSKQLSLGEAISRGRAPLPDIAEPAIGAIYEYTAYGWLPMEYRDADNIEY